MLYQTSLCFTMLPYALPDLSVLYNASQCFTRPLCALQCFPMLYQTSLCFTMLPYALPDLSVLYNASLCFTRPLCALQCFPVLSHGGVCVFFRYVSCASNEEEHNLTVFQLRGRIYYRVSQPIEVGSELLVWIGEEYARILGLNLGQHFKYEFGEKELLMKLFQDLQVKPLPLPPPPLAAAPKTQPPPSSPPDHTPNQYSKMVSTIIQAQKASYQTGNATEVNATGGNAGYPFLEGTQNLVSLGRAQSRYWTFFGFRGDSYGRIMDKTKIICKLCAVLLSYSGNTTNLRQHLIYKHRAEYNQLVGAQSALPPPPKKPSDPPLPPPASVPNGTPPKPAGLNRVTRAVAEFLVRDLLPPETVQGEGFLLMMSALDPAYQVPRPRGLLREAHSRARLGQLRDLEAGSAGGCALSLDFWEHREGGSYLTLLAHFVDDSFRFHNLVLCSRPSGRGARLRERAGEWGVGSPSFVVHGSGVRVAPLSVLPVGWRGVPCAGQVFRGCVEGVLAREDVSRAMRRARVMAQRLLSSPVEAARFRGREPFLRGKLRSLSLEGAQWHSIQALAQCLSEHRLLLSSLREVGGAGEQQQKEEEEEEEEEEGCGLDSQDWDLLRDLGDVLKPLAVASATLAADRFSSLSLVKPLLTSLVYKHLAPADSDSQFTSEVKASLREGLAGSYSDPQVNQTLNLACALDPRFRGLDFLSQADRVETFHLLKREASQLAEGPDSAALSCPKERDGGGEIRDRRSDTDAPPAPKKAKPSGSGIEFLLGDLCSVRSSSAGSARQQAEQEIGSFQTSEASSLCQEPLNWWKVHRSQYPLLARAARKFLAVPATAVPADWVFTDKGGGVYRKRAGLSPEDVDLMVFLHGNNYVEFHGDSNNNNNNNNNNTVNNVNSTKKD
ncbi:E3 SUMO-protein ligase ZBED1-like [Acipenser ruthenus]|uniref:E3 SUMO-protein ligase ZBED1-like n=1 Tax=Acipenser ruthenus TaxID=7906 RepID=UPI0027427752|nr:E3 SUMO-protein ligase ZBED1-like [Acipenser ruthenus]